MEKFDILGNLDMERALQKKIDAFCRRWAEEEHKYLLETGRESNCQSMRLC
jgi:hypothetical protein